MTGSFNSAASPLAAVSTRLKAWRVLHLLATAVLCVVAWTWLIERAELSALLAQVDQLPALAWVLAGAGLLGGHCMRALRLQTEWRHVRLVSWLQCLRLVLVHNAFVLMLPLRSGEGAYLWAVRRQWGVDWRSAGLALLRWRLQDAAVLAVLAAALLAPLPLLPRLVLALAVAAALGGFLPPLWSWLAARAGGGAPGMPAGRGPWSGILASAANWSLKVLANGGLLAALIGISLNTALRGALGGELAGVQPFQPPAGLGTYEGGVWLAVQLPATTTSRVVAAALAVHAFSLAVALGAAALAQLLAARTPGREPLA